MLLMLVGCGDDTPYRWGISDITIEGSAEFESAIEVAADSWNLAMEERCGGAVLTIVERGGHPVREYSASDWMRLNYPVDAFGFFDGEQVAIKANIGVALPHTSVHELGHALALPHVPFDVDPQSVMVPQPIQRNVIPSAGDVERMSVALGCGP